MGIGVAYDAGFCCELLQILDWILNVSAVTHAIAKHSLRVGGVLTWQDITPAMPRIDAVHRMGSTAMFTQSWTRHAVFMMTSTALSALLVVSASGKAAFWLSCFLRG